MPGRLGIPAGGGHSLVGGVAVARGAVRRPRRSVHTLSRRARFIDTRSGLGAPRALLAPGATITVRPPGLPSDVTAVTLNVTTTAATRSTSISVFPAGQVPRSSSVLNTGPGRTTAAAVAVGVGPGGAVTLRNTSGGLHVIADLAGYYSTGSSSGLVGSFRRVLDTRSGLGAPARRVDPSRLLTITLPGLPAGTRAVNLNLTATRAQGAGHLTSMRAVRRVRRRPTSTSSRVRPSRTSRRCRSAPAAP